MTPFVAFVALTATFFPTGGLAADDAAVRTRESFNTGWRFARFGPMADGSTRPEPGAERWSVTATASSEESSKGNLAANAFDGDAQTRWCASGAGTDQWVQLDLGHEQKLGRVALEWEFPELTYGSVIETRADGNQWSAFAPGPARFVRVRVTQLPEGKWASVREVRLSDSEGQPIKNTRVAGGEAPSMAAFGDSDWRALDIPHDWGVEGPFRDDLPGDTGKLPWKGIGWYRKHFEVPAADQGKRIFIDFDGAMANAKVWLNGQEVGGWPYGYQPFRLELTQHVKFGSDNVLAVRLDTAHWGSRWYPGAGLYRNVWLVKTSSVHVNHWGVFVTTPSITDEQGVVHIDTSFTNQSSESAELNSVFQVLAFADGIPGEVVASAPPSASYRFGAGAAGHAEASLTVPNPGRWEPARPLLYLARVTLRQGDRVVDVYDQPFGFRTIEFTHNDGFKLNGKRVFLKGTCNHHDLGPLGAALNVRALERQLQILKEMGGNALRTSHNPPAPELLELADRLGFVVMVEAFDCWKRGKTPGDYSRLFDAWHAKDLQAMVRR